MRSTSCHILSSYPYLYKLATQEYACTGIDLKAKNGKTEIMDLLLEIIKWFAVNLELCDKILGLIMVHIVNDLKL